MNCNIAILKHLFASVFESLVGFLLQEEESNANCRLTFGGASNRKRGIYLCNVFGELV